ncbi:hypothetical protein Y032_1008g3377 [Ancylostoma ceylanicum]|uniref:Uncharacterized protein n=1 Tax=Ancylostoma ceylanicum TaxID=53326 RepID=A0A016W7Q5_9BILA|nr:hypothetical protein Y032_1008g3377 [Ancylostoma ceylanicum]
MSAETNFQEHLFISKYQNRNIDEEDLNLDKRRVQYKLRRRNRCKGIPFRRFYKELDTREGVRDLHKLVQIRYRQAQDVTEFVGVNDEDGNPVNDQKKVAERWQRYFEDICRGIPASTSPTREPSMWSGNANICTRGRNGSKDDEAGKSN